MKLKRAVSFTMALILSVGLSVTSAFAAASDVEMEALKEEAAEGTENIIYDTENGEITGIRPGRQPESEAASEIMSDGEGEKIDSVLTLGEAAAFDAGNRVIVELPEAGDKKTVDLQIDHSLYPEARLYAFPYGGPGDCTIKVSGGEVSGSRSRTIRTKPASVYPAFDIKADFKLNGSDGVQDYTVTVSTSEGNASCALMLATKDTFAQVCGGRENAAFIQKNQATDYGVSNAGGLQALLQGTGEWFRYTADGDAYIYAFASAIHDFIVTVHDADTEEIVDQTDSKDRETEPESGINYISKKFSLQPGHDYFIQVQAASAKADSGYTYGFSVGLPGTISQMIEINSSSSFSIPANTTKTFSFKVSGYPQSARLGSYGRICFQTGSATSNLDITSLKITAPNGKVLIAPDRGQYDLSKPLDYENYLTSKDNIPLNGTWTVTVRSRAALSGLKFKIKCQVEHIPGVDGNE